MAEWNSDDVKKSWYGASSEKPVAHYYGDHVRMLFIALGALILISIPFDKALLPINIILGVAGVLFMTILAGYTNPRNWFSVLADAAAAGLAFVSFEYFAIEAYLGAGTFVDWIFLLREGIAILALLALYFSVKTLRGLSYRGPTSL